MLELDPRFNLNVTGDVVPNQIAPRPRRCDRRRVATREVATEILDALLKLPVRRLHWIRRCLKYPRRFFLEGERWLPAAGQRPAFVVHEATTRVAFRLRSWTGRAASQPGELGSGELGLATRASCVVSRRSRLGGWRRVRACCPFTELSYGTVTRRRQSIMCSVQLGKIAMNKSNEYGQSRAHLIMGHLACST